MFGMLCAFFRVIDQHLQFKLLKTERRPLCLTLSVRAEYIHFAASQATSPDGVYILHDFHKVVK
jgi:hypothetical protein